jgi:hydrogenase maturation protease
MAANNNPSSIINNQSAKRPVVVLGLGNPLMGDEGIGVYLVERLAKSAAEYPDVDFVDAGTGGLTVLHQIEGRRKAVFIDCAFMDQEPGAIRRFAPDEVRTRKVLTRQSLHEADLMQILAMAAQLGQAPKQVVLFGIQPQRVEPGQGLSGTLSARIDEYVGLILQELE